jgi:hypothetical protein
MAPTREWMHSREIPSFETREWMHSRGMHMTAAGS